MFPTDTPIVNASNGPFLPVPVCKAPPEGARICKIAMTFPGGGQVYNVNLNQGQAGGASFSQIASLYIDNTRCNQVLTIQFPDSGQIINVPGLSRQWAMALTGGLSFNAFMAPDGASRDALIVVCNFYVPSNTSAVSFLDENQQVFVINPNPTTFPQGTPIQLISGVPDYWLHITSMKMRRVNCQYVTTSPGTGVAYLIRDQGNGLILSAWTMECAQTAGQAVTDFDPSGYSYNGNLLLSQAGAGVEMINTAYTGGVISVGYIVAEFLYGYYAFPSIT